VARNVSVHSFRGGTGKSNITANLAVALARHGRRVGVVDTDVQSPGVHVLFGLGDLLGGPSLNDFLWGRCEIAAAAHDVSAVADSKNGRLFLVPASITAGDIARVVHDGYDVSQLHDGFERLAADLELDFLLVDTHPGINEETLLSVAVSDTSLVVLRPDQQDYLGTAVTLEVARRLDVPQLLLILNKVPAAFDADELARHAEATYGCPVAAVLRHADEIMTLGSGGLFMLRFPEHEVTRRLEAVADRLLAGA
jgi:septum site-determining protein MinD